MAQSDRRRERGVPKGAADDSAREPSRRLAAIMFTDLVGYSALAHRDEDLAIELLEMHRDWVRDILPRYGGIEIETVGDAFLIEFAGALAAVECAVAIQRRFEEHNAAVPADRRMELRIGIHLGDVEHRGDKVFGDGVNIASRIHGMARPGGICVSEDVHHAVRNRPAFQFASLGSPPLKNITTALELFELAPSLSLASPAPAGKAAGAIPVAGKPRRWLPAAAAAVLVALAGVAALLLRPGGEAPAPGGASVAVLPFANMSADRENEYFADGVHDTILTHLSRIRDLKVISRTSVMEYRNTTRNLREIAGALGVAHIVEGSVQRQGNRVRINAQLIRADTDAHLWSENYDRDVADVFAIQSDVARNVAAAVHARLTPQERAGIESAPTTTPEAYDLYLRAVLVDRRVQVQAEEYRQAIGWLEQAIALDPAYAPAHALLAHLHDSLYWAGHDPTDARREQVGRSADAALRLGSALPEAHVAKALFHYHGWRNYEAALAELELARNLAPGNAKVHFWIATIYRRQGRWDEALASLERATTLDPLNTGHLSEHGGTLQMMRRYDEARTVLGRAATLEPENPLWPVILAYHHLFATGDVAPLEKAAAGLPAGFDPDCQASGLRVELAILQRRFTDAVAAGAACKQKFLPGSGGTQIPLEYYGAQVKWLAGGRKAPPEAIAAREILEKMLLQRPDSAELHMHLGFVLAMLGERQRAIEEAERALALMPLSRDALTGAQMRRGAVEVYANAGAEERAITELEQLMRLPNGGHIHAIRLDPMVDPLRASPRFEKLLAEHVPKGSGA